MKTKFLLLATVACFYMATVSNAQTVPSYVPTNGLVGWWPFNGNAIDQSTNNLGGSVLGGPTLTIDRNGNSNASYDFDYSTVSFGGQTDEVYIPYNSILNSTNISVSVWVYPRSYYWTGNPDLSIIINRFQYGYSNPNGQVWSIGLTPTNLSAAIWAAAPNNSQASAGVQAPSLSLNTWSNVIFTYDGSFLKLYVNGVFANSTASSILLNTAGNSGISVGESNQANGYWNPTDGKIDDIGLWNRALTQQEITALYTGTTPCTKPEPVTLGTSASTELCPSESVTIKIVTPADSANYTYQWTRNGTNLSGATTRSITVNDAAKYKVFVRSGPGVDCQRVSGLVETTPSTPPNVTATAPNGTIYCPGDSVLMTAAGATSGYSYRWKRFGVVIPGATSSTFYATQTGNYRCEIFNAGGCITQSNLISITNGLACRVMGEKDSDVRVYPNPAKNNFTVSFNDIGNEMPVSVSLRTMQGQVIEDRNITTKEDVQFTAGKLSPGFYLVSILLDSGDSIVKSVVVK